MHPFDVLDGHFSLNRHEIDAILSVFRVLKQLRKNKYNLNFSTGKHLNI